MEDREAILRVARHRNTTIRRLRFKETVILFFMSEIGEEGSPGWQYLRRAWDARTEQHVYWEPDDPSPNVAPFLFEKGRDTFFAVAYASHDGIGIWHLPKTVLSALVTYEEQYGTLLDRPYKITRNSEDRDGSHEDYYAVEPMPPTERPHSLEVFKQEAKTYLNDQLLQQKIIPQPLTAKTFTSSGKLGPTNHNKNE